MGRKWFTGTSKLQYSMRIDILTPTKEMLWMLVASFHFCHAPLGQRTIPEPRLGGEADYLLGRDVLMASTICYLTYISSILGTHFEPSQTDDIAELLVDLASLMQCCTSYTCKTISLCFGQLAVKAPYLLMCLELLRCRRRASVRPGNFFPHPAGQAFWSTANSG